MAESLRIAFVVLVCVLVGCSADSEPQVSIDEDADMEADVGRDAEDVSEDPVEADADGEVLEDADADVVSTPGFIDVTGAALDFGTWGCGASAPAAQGIAIENPGETAVSYRVELRGQAEWFRVSDPGPGVIPAGGSVTVGVQPRWSPEASTLVGEHAVEIVVTAIGQPSVGDTTGAVVRVEGAMLGGGWDALGGARFELGQVAVGQTASATTLYGLDPASSGPVTLAFDKRGDAAFAFSWLNSPGTVTLTPGATVAVTATFAPVLEGVQSASLVPRVVNGAVCRDTSVPFSVGGDGSSDAVQVEGSLDFGATACNTRASARTVTVRNVTASVVPFRASLVGGAFYTVSPPSGTLPPQGTATLTVTPTQVIPSEAASLSRSFADLLLVSTDLVGDRPNSLPVRQEGTGAVIALQAPFGDELSAAAGGSADAEVWVVNRGRAAYDARLFSTDPDLSFPAGDTVRVGAGETARVALRYTATLTEARRSGVWLDDAAPGLCQGSGRFLSFFLRPVSAARGTVDGLVFPRRITMVTGCGETAAPQLIPITNPSGRSVTVAAAFDGDDGFGLLIGGEPWTEPLTVAPGATVVATLTAPAMPRRARLVRGGSIALTTASPPSIAFVEVHESSYGYALRWESKSALPDHPVGATFDFTPMLVNDGNAAVDVTVTSAPSGAVDTGRVQADGVLMPRVHVEEVPLGPSVVGATAEVVTRGVAYCTESPVASAEWDVTGVTGEVVVFPPALEFGQTWCHREPPGAQTFTVRNDGGAGFAFTLEASSGGRYALEPTSGTLAPGESQVIVVTPGPLLDGEPGARTDLVLLWTDIPGAPPQTVELNTTIRGAMVRLPQEVRLPSTEVNATSSAPLFFELVDARNSDLELVEEEGQGTFEFALAPDGDDGDLNAPVVIGRFTPRALGPHSTTLRLRAAADAPFCRPDLGVVTVRGDGLEGSPLVVTNGWYGSNRVSLPNHSSRWVSFCGEAGTGLLKLFNPSESPITFDLNAAQGEASNLTFEPSHGTVAPGARLDVAVTAAAVLSMEPPEDYVATFVYPFTNQYYDELSDRECGSHSDCANVYRYNMFDIFAEIHQNNIGGWVPVMFRHAVAGAMYSFEETSPSVGPHGEVVYDLSRFVSSYFVSVSAGRYEATVDRFHHFVRDVEAGSDCRVYNGGGLVVCAAGSGATNHVVLSVVRSSDPQLPFCMEGGEVGQWGSL